MRIQNLWKVVALAALLVPFVASAQVVISEIMYDVSGEVGADDTREWVEIFNAGSTAQDITGWKFKDGTNHTLNVPPQNGGIGSLTIPSGGYAILADDATTFRALYPSVGTVIDTLMDLNNTAETVSLINSDGGTADTISYVKENGAAGDGNSLHRESVSGTSFTAGSPTPGAGSLSPSSGAPDTSATTTDSTSSPQATTNTPAPTSSYVAPPEPQIFADAGDNRTVIVAADTEFLGRAYNRKKETISSRIRFLWNFGDGRTAEGESVLHHFEYPGRYAVVLNIAENRDAASDRIIVTAEPAKLALTAFSDGSIMIGNSAGHDLDLSRWIVRSFGRSFVLPQGSIILAGESLRMGEKILGFRSSPETELDYPNGALALRAGTASADADSGKSDMSAAAPLPANSPATPDTPAAPPPVPSDAEEEQGGVYSTETVGAADSIEDTPASSSQAAAGAAVSDSGGAYLWWLGAIGLAVVGGGAMVAARHVRRREWDIVEEKEG